MKHCRRLLFFTTLLWLGTACDSSPRSNAADYAQRLSNVLDAPLTLSDSIPSNFPRRRDLKTSAPENTLSVREFLSFRQCKLHSAVANKNSLLGKFAKNSQTLFLDLAILETGPDCVETLTADGQQALADKLSALLITKQRGLKGSLWQAILGSEENAKFWSNTSQPHDYPANTSDNSERAINNLSDFVNKVLDGDYALNGAQKTSVESSLQSLKQGDAGALLARLNHLSNALQAASGVVRARLNSPLCLNKSATTSARYLQNIVHKFFILKVQKDAVLLQRRYQELMPTYQKMERALASAAPRAYQDWVKSRNKTFANGLDASKNHALLLQELYAQCGLQPSADRAE